MRQRNNSLAKTFENIIEGTEDFVAETTSANFAPNLLDWIHLRRIRWNMKEVDVMRHNKCTRFVPCSAITNEQDLVIRVLRRKPFEKGIRAECVTPGHNQKVVIPRTRVYSAKHIAVFADMVARYIGSVPCRPTVLWRVDASKSSFVLKHDPDMFVQTD